LNAVRFLLLGLQLPVVLAESGARDRGRLLAVGLGISVVAIALRLGWMFAGAVLAHLRSRETPLRANVIALLGWSGMRGVLSLATALAVPATLAGGAPFPGRAEILFYAFSVIVVTLVVQGLPLPWIIRWLDIPRDEPRHEEDALARARTARAARDRLDELMADGDELTRELAAEMRDAQER